ncbi:MAG: hypothetical protein K6U80_16075 [Firmicutes bacterium]|nr:hypothetical protein [Bacillota bacterium]
MAYYLIGIDHQSADPGLRARYHLTMKQIAAIYGSHRVPPDTVILSTCNRTEFYFDSLCEVIGLRDSLAEVFSVQVKDWTGFYLKQGEEALLHLIRLAVGLQSMIIGETEILSQLGAAYELAQRTGNISEFSVWGCLFGKIHEYARYIRKKSKIGAYSSSLASLVVKEVKQYFENQMKSQVQKFPKALILGNGVIAQKISRAFVFQGIPVAIISRNSEPQPEYRGPRAGEIQRYSWERLGQVLAEADIVVAATTAPHFLLKKGHFEQLGGKVLIDLAFPRNIDPGVTAVVNCELWDLAYFGKKTAANQALKRQAVEKAEYLCFQALKRFQATNPVENQNKKLPRRLQTQRNTKRCYL